MNLMARLAGSFSRQRYQGGRMCRGPWCTRCRRSSSADGAGGSDTNQDTVEHLKVVLLHYLMCAEMDSLSCGAQNARHCSSGLLTQ